LYRILVLLEGLVYAAASTKAAVTLPKKVGAVISPAEVNDVSVPTVVILGCELELLANVPTKLPVATTFTVEIVFANVITKGVPPCVIVAELLVAVPIPTNKLLPVFNVTLAMFAANTTLPKSNVWVSPVLATIPVTPLIATEYSSVMLSCVFANAALIESAFASLGNDPKSIVCCDMSILPYRVFIAINKLIVTKKIARRTELF
jgi:hypothetical protein